MMVISFDRFNTDQNRLWYLKKIAQTWWSRYHMSLIKNDNLKHVGHDIWHRFHTDLIWICCGMSLKGNYNLKHESQEDDHGHTRHHIRVILDDKLVAQHRRTLVLLAEAHRSSFTEYKHSWLLQRLAGEADRG